MATLNLPYDVASLRADFPILSRTVHGKPLVYLDNAASAQKPRPVLEAMEQLYEQHYANVHRGVHSLSGEATELFEAAREKVRGFLNAKDAREIVFTRGATEAINLVAQTFGRSQMVAGDEVVVSALEHHANIVPWQLLAAERGIVLKVAPVTAKGELDMAAYAALLSPRTKLVAMSHVSNAIGSILPIARVIEIAHAQGVPVLVDGCQAAPHMDIDVQALDADFYVFSAHKIYGPTGIGALYGKADLLNSLPPWQGGGDMIERVSFAGTTYKETPQRFEAGTPAIAEGIGFGAAVDYVNAIGKLRIRAHEQALLDYVTPKLQAIPGFRLYGEAADKAAILSFTISGAHPQDVGTLLDRQGVAIRTGHHCCMPLMEFFGVGGTCRASFGLYNTFEEADALVTAVKKAAEMLA